MVINKAKKAFLLYLVAGAYQRWNQASKFGSTSELIQCFGVVRSRNLVWLSREGGSVVRCGSRSTSPKFVSIWVQGFNLSPVCSGHQNYQPCKESCSVGDRVGNTESHQFSLHYFANSVIVFKYPEISSCCEAARFLITNSSLLL